MRANAQDREVELRFADERDHIKANKIFHVAERECFNFSESRDCQSSDADLKHEYFFDEEGNLTTVKEYLSGSIKVTSYLHGKNGGYQEKTYNCHDEDGKLMSQKKWILEFNDKEQIIKERLSGGIGTSRINLLEYDEHGNLSAKTTDSSFRWTQTFNDKSQIIAQREWRQNPKLKLDSFRCISLTTYDFTDGKLMREVMRNCSSNEVSKDLTYKYDSNKYLVEIFERRTFWRHLNNGPTEPDFRNWRIVFLNDKVGNPIKKCTFSENGMVIRCVFYSYNSSRLSESEFDFVKVDIKKTMRVVNRIKKHPGWRAWATSVDNIKEEDIRYSHPSKVIRGNKIYISAKLNGDLIMEYKMDSKTYELLDLPSAKQKNDLR